MLARLERVWYWLRSLLLRPWPLSHPAPNPEHGWGRLTGGPKLGRVTSLLPPPSSWFGPRLSYGMLENDILGDCVFAAIAHACMAVAYYLKRPVSFVASQVGGWYLNWNHGQDVGCIPNAVLYAWQTDSETGTAFYGFGQAAPFGEVDPTNVNEVKSAIATFGAVLLSANLQQAQETQFNNRQMWDFVPGSQVVGGHEVVAVGFNSTGPLIVSWGRAFRATWGWVTNVCDAAATGVFPAALAAGKFVEPLVSLDKYISELPPV